MAETAKDKLKKMVAWTAAPELTDGEIDELLVQSSIVDPAGLAPSETGWVPTYDLNSAAAAGWLIKAGRASELIGADPPAPAFLHPRYSIIAVQWQGSMRQKCGEACGCKIYTEKRICRKRGCRRSSLLPPSENDIVSEVF